MRYGAMVIDFLRRGPVTPFRIVVTSISYVPGRLYEARDRAARREHRRVEAVVCAPERAAAARRENVCGRADVRHRTDFELSEQPLSVLSRKVRGRDHVFEESFDG
ncbi:MAG: hypothetical protein ACXW5H_07670 [Thermoanaerobaculia bacterium]